MSLRASLLLVVLAAQRLYAFDYPFREKAIGRRVSDIALPPGFRRVAIASGSFGAYLRGAPLLPAGAPVRRYDGREVLSADRVAAVLDMPLLNKDQQCADSALRYWFEYLRESGRPDAIAARLTDGTPVSLSEWKKGRRRPGESDEALYRRFLAHCFAYVGSASLHRDLPVVRARDLAPGDLIVQPNPRGGVGHLSIVFDAAQGPDGQRLYLIGYGYLPAQSVYLALPEPSRGLAGARGCGAYWFTLEGFQAQHRYLGERFVYHRFPRLVVP